MKHIKKILAMLMVVAMLVTSLASCGEGEGGGGGTPAADLNIIANGASDFKIVYAKEGETWEQTFAKKISASLNTALGVKLEVVADTDVAGDANSKEIIIATEKNTRSSTYTPTADLGAGYAMRVDGNRLIIEVGSKTGASIAHYQLIKDLFGVDLENGEKLQKVTDKSSITVKSNYTASRAMKSSFFPYLDYANFKISYSTKYSDFCCAVDVQNNFKMYLKEEIALARELTDFSDQSVCYFNLAYDPSLNNGDWKFSVSGNLVTCSAGDYQGMNAAVGYLDEFRHADGYYTFKQGDAKEGNYIDSLDKNDAAQTSKYTYDRQGEYRVMFNNVLWGSSYTHTDGSHINYPQTDRTMVQAEWIAEYMPDVLGCQEFDISRRGGVSGGPGNGGLVAELADLGYAEAFDPRVRNAYPKEEKIPGTDASLTVEGATPGEELNGYGGGYKVTYDIDGDGVDDEYYTYYNCVPIFYNTATTKIVEEGGKKLTGYLWYKEQWDKITGEEHENGAQDCASKAASWGVFESLETDERYIVISTHMCTRSDYIRGFQAKELIAFVEKLTADYDYPVFFGGDMNGNYGSANYEAFVDAETGIFKSLQDYRDPETKMPLCSVYTSKTGSNHAYPDYDQNNYILTTGGKPWSVTNTEAEDRKDGNSIDQIFVNNYEDRVDFKAFGVVVDVCTLRGSDHLPIMVDFDINSAK